MQKIILLTLALFTGGIANAQSITKETIQWNASGFKDLDANADFSNSCQFITYGTQKVKWIQDNGKSIVELNVTNTVGAWADVNKSGSITYKISDGTAKGDLILKRASNEWQIDLTLLGGTSDIRLRYTVSSIQKL